MTEKFRSKFESRFAAHLRSHGVPCRYETDTVKYEIPASMHTYHPDFKIGNTYIETKGLLKLADRKKMCLVRAQHPELKFILVFMNSKLPIGKGSKTTYGDWSSSNGFEFYDKEIPAWRLKELMAKL